MESVVAQIRERIDYERMFSEFLDLSGSGAERSARCIFHDDNNPSMSVNVEEGIFYCHNDACGARGDFIDFYCRVRSLTFREALGELAVRVGIEFKREADPEEGVIDEAIVEANHERLLNTDNALRKLEERRGITEDTVRAWELGHDGRRYYIPIRDEVGRCVNIRRYDPDASDSTAKMISWRRGFGAARIWPFSSLDRVRGGDDEFVLITEGEMDCLVALQMGFAAMTATGGAGTWRSTWNHYFRGVDVVICYDADEAGHRGAVNVARNLRGVASSVRIVRLPLTEPPGADLTDYFIGHGMTSEDFRGLVERASEFEPSDETGIRPPDEEPVELHLSKASEAENLHRLLRMDVMVSGKNTSPYVVPDVLELSCSMPGLNMCERCPVAAEAGKLRLDIDYDSNEILRFCHAKDVVLQREYKRRAGVPKSCGYVDAEVIEGRNVEQVQLIPEIDRSTEDTEYVTRSAFFLGHGLRPNTTYRATGYMVPDPDNQMATHIIHGVIPSKSNIDAFKLTDDVVNELSVFQPEGSGLGALWRKLDDVYDDLELYTRIYQRRDLMVATDLTFHSVLTFDFQGERLTRGWIESLIIGDSRTGKSTIVQRMMDYYSAGELASGENTTLAGLVGGLHQIGESWALRWGKIPLNDRRLLVIDEAGNLSEDQIGRMSAMRSSGVAEVIKIHTERTTSRTRMIWISNPRGNQPLSSYSQGVLAVKELIGAPEDIARFDIVTTSASEDVPLDVINARREPTDEDVRYTRRLCHQRVMWAWSRSPEQVRWCEGSEKRVLKHATSHGQRYKYAVEIPIVEPNEQRVTIARIAVAAAAMFFSTDTGKNVLVRPEHVDFAADFLRRIYSKPSLSFEEYARLQQRRYEIRNNAQIRDIVNREAGAARQLMENEQFTQRDLMEILDVGERDDVRDIISTLRKSGFLKRRGSSYYYKTPAAIRFLRDHLRASEEDTPANIGGTLWSEEDALPEAPDF